MNQIFMQQMSFKRMNVNSMICYGELDKLLYNENANTIILQIVSLGTQRVCDDGIVRDEFLCEYIDKPKQSEMAVARSDDIDFENYLDTTINKDPFGAKYSGKKIREVFENGDIQWLEKALKELRNEFLRDRLQYIVDRGGYGKIQC